MTELEIIIQYLDNLIKRSPNLGVNHFLENEIISIQNRIESSKNKIKPWSNIKGVIDEKTNH